MPTLNYMPARDTNEINQPELITDDEILRALRVHVWHSIYEIMSEINKNRIIMNRLEINESQYLNQRQYLIQLLENLIRQKRVIREKLSNIPHEEQQNMIDLAVDAFADEQARLGKLNKDEIIEANKLPSSINNLPIYRLALPPGSSIKSWMQVSIKQIQMMFGKKA